MRRPHGPVHDALTAETIEAAQVGVAIAEAADGAGNRVHPMFGSPHLASTQNASAAGIPQFVPHMVVPLGSSPGVVPSPRLPIESIAAETSGEGLERDDHPPQILSPHPESPHITGPPPTGPHITGPPPTGPYITGPSRTGPYITGPSRTGPHITEPPRTGPHMTGPYMAGPYVPEPHAMGPHFTGPHVADPDPVDPRIAGPHAGGPHVAGPSVQSAAEPGGGRSGAGMPSGMFDNPGSPSAPSNVIRSTDAPSVVSPIDHVRFETVWPDDAGFGPAEPAGPRSDGARPDVAPVRGDFLTGAPPGDLPIGELLPDPPLAAALLADEVRADIARRDAQARDVRGGGASIGDSISDDAMGDDAMGDDAVSAEAVSDNAVSAGAMSGADLGDELSDEPVTGAGPIGAVIVAAVDSDRSHAPALDDDAQRNDADRLATDRGATDRSATDRGATDRNATDRYGTERYDGERHDADRHDTDRRYADRHYVDRHYVDRHRAERRSVDGPHPRRADPEFSRPEPQQPPQDASGHAPSEQFGPERRTGSARAEPGRPGSEHAEAGYHDADKADVERNMGGPWSRPGGPRVVTPILPHRVPAPPDVPDVPDDDFDDDFDDDSDFAVDEDTARRAAVDGPELTRIASGLRQPPAEPPPLPEELDVAAVLAAVRQVIGVRDAQLRPNPGGVHTLRLDLADGADAGWVSRQVARLLKEKMGLAAEPRKPRRPPTAGTAVQPPRMARADGGMAGQARGVASARSEAPHTDTQRPDSQRMPRAGPAGAGLSGAGLSGAGLSGAGLSGAAAARVPADPAIGVTYSASAPVAPLGRPTSLADFAKPAAELGGTADGDVDHRPDGDEGADHAADGSVVAGSVKAGSVTAGSVMTGNVKAGSVMTGNVVSGSRPTGSAADAAARPANRHGDEATGAVVRIPRVVLEQVRVATLGTEATVEVRLWSAGTPAIGTAAGPAVDGYLLRLAAQATAGAIDSLVAHIYAAAPPIRCFIDHAGVVPFGDCVVAVVVVLVSGDGWVDQLVGSALVTGDPRHAVARATLDAVNRRLERLLGYQAGH